MSNIYPVFYLTALAQTSLHSNTQYKLLLQPYIINPHKF